MKSLFIIVVIIAVFVIGFFLINKNKASAPEMMPDTKIMQTLKITSSAFETGGIIPPKYTCDGININPPLIIEGIPKEAKTLVLIMDDPDAPMGVWDHWIKWNIPVVGETMSFEEEKEPSGISGKNSSGGLSYQGPCPPDKEHRYFFKIYALDSELDLPGGANKQEVERAMENYVIASGELMGKYDRIKQ